MKGLLVVAALLTTLGMACAGGNGDEVLHMMGGDIGERDYRAFVRQRFVVVGAVGFCLNTQGLSPAEMWDVLVAAEGEGNIAKRSPKGWKDVPGQESGRDSQLRIGAIFIGECERILQ